MKQTASLGNVLGENIYDKIGKLYSQLFRNKLLHNFSAIEKERINVIINEIKYDANRLRNYRQK